MSLARYWSLCGAAAVLALASTLLTQAAPKPRTVPPGKIYFLRSTPDYSFSECWSMLADGSNKTRVPTYPPAGEPNRRSSVHGSWFLTAKSVDGSHPNGAGRYELFATDEVAGSSVQLTNDALLQHFTIASAARWAHDDSFISFAAITWTPVAEGGDFTDPSGQRWQVGSGVFVAEIDWVDGQPVAGSPVGVLSAGLYWESTGALEAFYARPDVISHDWAPSADQLVIEKVSQDLSTGKEYHDLFTISLDAVGGVASTQPLGPGRTPEWSPSGNRIAFWRYDAQASNVWLINPDGSNAVQLTSGGTGGPDYRPRWSPDGNYLAFTRSFHNKQRNSQGPYTVTTNAVMRVPLTGGSPVNLTNDLEGDSAFALGWR